MRNCLRRANRLSGEPSAGLRNTYLPGRQASSSKGAARATGIHAPIAAFSSPFTKRKAAKTPKAATNPNNRTLSQLLTSTSKRRPTKIRPQKPGWHFRKTAQGPFQPSSCKPSQRPTTPLPPFKPTYTQTLPNGAPAQTSRCTVGHGGTKRRSVASRWDAPGTDTTAMPTPMRAMASRLQGQVGDFRVDTMCCTRSGPLACRTLTNQGACSFCSSSSVGYPSATVPRLRW